MHLNEPFYLQKVFCAFFDFATAKLAFNESVASVVKMKYQVGFQSIAVTVIRQMVAKAWGVSPKVSRTHLFKDESKGLELGFQSFSVYA